jgi:hypothetical protein
LSIYATILDLSADEHDDDCAVWVETSPGLFDRSGKPCDCGDRKRGPIVYEGSHVLPSDDDRRGGSIDLASIPDFITRDGRDDAQGQGLKDWLRLGVHSEPSREQYQGKPYVAGGDATVILDRPLVEALRDELTAWLEREESC